MVEIWIVGGWGCEEKEEEKGEEKERRRRNSLAFR